MRMEIIAEGVETFDQVTYLRERGIGAAQGYVFAPPLPAATFLQLLEAMDPVADAAGKADARIREIRPPAVDPAARPLNAFANQRPSAVRYRRRHERSRLLRLNLALTPFVQLVW